MEEVESCSETDSCEPCGECHDSYCPFTEKADYLPFPLIYEYLTLKKQNTASTTASSFTGNPLMP